MYVEKKMNVTPKQNIKTGIVLALIASLCSTLMSVFVKLIGNGQSVSTIVFARFDWFIWSINLNYMELLGMGLIISGGILTMVFAE